MLRKRDLWSKGNEIKPFFSNYLGWAYLVMTEFRVHNEHMARGPQTPLFVPPVAEVTAVVVVRGLHGHQSEEAAIVGTAGAKG